MKEFLAFLAFLVISFVALILSTAAGPAYVTMFACVAIFVVLCLIYSEVRTKK